MEDKIVIPLSAAQRDLLFKYGSDFADHNLFRLISVALKKDDGYEICVDHSQLIGLLTQIAQFLFDEEDEELGGRLDDLGAYLSSALGDLGDDDYDKDDFDEDDDDDYEHSSNTGAVCILKVALAFEKKIWRKIAIRQGQTLHDLHQAIFDAFDRYDEHMYSFFFSRSKRKFNPRTIYDSSEEFTHPYACEDQGVFGSDAYNASLSRLEILNLTEKQKFYYIFDFGDEWWHEITVEKTDGQTDEGEYPRTIKKNGDSPEQYPDYDEDEDY